MPTIDTEEIVHLTEQYGGPWGLNHTRRLLHLVDIISQDVEYDRDAVWLAAYLHDWGGYAPWAQKGYEAAHKRRQKVPALLCLDRSRQLAADRLRTMDELLANLERESFDCF